MPKYKVGETVVIDMYGERTSHPAHYLYLKKLYFEYIVGKITSVSSTSKPYCNLYHVKCKNKYGHPSIIAVLEGRILGKADDVDILAKVI